MIISFETAKLAKEKRFDIEVMTLYNENKEIKYHPLFNLYNWNQDNPPINQYSAPTQSLLQKWLREKHEIHVNPVANFYNKKKLMGYIYTIDKFIDNIHDGIYYDKEQIHSLGDVQMFETYEQALEQGLLEGLKLIK